ncbi:MAG: FprA family A-type flavoprotein [Oscillospiraceae bacterium]|nr:FprA family A-type flavoprotein [Oscillospiraceae bacterium]
MTNITADIRYVGVNDHELDLFEGQYIVPEGMAYNSYVILDEKTAVMDSVEVKFGEAWLQQLREVLGGKSPDYLIIQHMEPDHSANIRTFAEAFPDAVLVGNAKTFAMFGQFFPHFDLPDSRKKIVKDGETLSLGRHELRFLFAPMVHWPEVMFTYDKTDKVLFSADAFGKFGALDTAEEDWVCEARRYYFGIVGKYGMQVQNVLKKAKALDIQTICPLHGPVLNENLPYYLDLYNTWSSYGVESEGVCIAYTSVYGHTKEAAELLEKALIASGCPKVAITDLAREDMAEAVEDAFRYGKLVLATTTYNADIFPFMKHFIDDLTERGYQNRKIGLIENGTWAPMAAKVMKGMFEKSKNITFAETVVSIKSALTQQNREQIAALADEMMAS